MRNTNDRTAVSISALPMPRIGPVRAGGGPNRRPSTRPVFTGSLGEIKFVILGTSISSSPSAQGVHERALSE